MTKKSKSQKAERTEKILIGAGFLLKMLHHSYGENFGIGMTEQVSQCIRDIDQIARSIQQREAAKAPEYKA